MTPMRKVKTLFYRLHQQHHRCFYCGIDLTGDVEITVDHVTPMHLSYIVPRTFDDPKNIVACCKQCNTDKAGRMPSEDEVARLAVLNEEFDDALSDAHYNQMLRLSAHMMKALSLYGLR
jgi:5-methylcytosine-specific restriction endonuclease McrA